MCEGGYPFYKEEKICPRCGKHYDGYPALSRRDNKTKICPECGVTEALEDYADWLIKNKEDRDATY